MGSSSTISSTDTRAYRFEEGIGCHDRETIVERTPDSRTLIRVSTRDVSTPSSTRWSSYVSRGATGWFCCAYVYTRVRVPACVGSRTRVHRARARESRCVNTSRAIGWGYDASLSDAPRLRQSNRDRLRVTGRCWYRPCIHHRLKDVVETNEPVETRWLGQRSWHARNIPWNTLRRFVDENRRSP